MSKGMLSKSPLANEIRKAIGVGLDEPVEVTTPQFTRSPNEKTPESAPEGVAGFDALRRLPACDLQHLGLRQWGCQEDAHGKEFGPMLWLFPGEWYDHIPNGYEIVDINFNKERFQRGQTDNDIRFGCLPFGIIGPK